MRSPPLAEFCVHGVTLRVEIGAMLPLLVLPQALGVDGDERAVVTWSALAIATLLVHALGRVLALKRAGATDIEVTCDLAGIRTTASEPVRTVRARVGAVLSATATSAAVGVMSCAAHALGGPGWAGLFGWTNLGWAAINLLPIRPFDLGTAVDVSLSGPARRRFEVGSLAVTVLLLVVAIFAGVYLAAFVFATAAVRVGLQTHTRIADDRDSAFQSNLDPIARMLDERRVGDAIEGARRLLASTAASEARRAQAFELLAWAHLFAGDRRAACDAAGSMRGARPSALLVAVLDVLGGGSAGVDFASQGWTYAVDALASNGRAAHAVERAIAVHGAAPESLRVAAHRLFLARQHRESAAVSRAAFERSGDVSHLYNAACALGWIDPEAALAALREATDRGFGSAPRFEADPDLEPLREHAEYRALLASIAAP